MTSRVDKAAARATQLAQEVQGLEAELAAVAQEQAQLEALRKEERSDFEAVKSDLELGLEGIRKALVLLRKHFGAASSAALLQQQDDARFSAAMRASVAPSGAGRSIIDLLEVVESDFAASLAKAEAAEAEAQASYEQVAQENAVAKTTKDQAVKYKTQETKAQSKTASEYRGDRETASTEFSAVEEYFVKIQGRCLARPETYSGRQRRREAEIAGLMEALAVLQDEAALVQRRKGSSPRGFLAVA